MTRYEELTKKARDCDAAAIRCLTKGRDGMGVYWFNTARDLRDTRDCLTIGEAYRG